MKRSRQVESGALPLAIPRPARWFPSRPAQARIIDPFESLFASSVNPGPRLRVGILLQNYHLPEPAARLIQHLQRCEFVDLAGAIVTATAASLSAGPFIYSLYRTLDTLLHPKHARALARRDCTSLLAAVETLHADCDPSGLCVRASKAQLASIASRRFDVIVVLGAVPDPIELAAASRFGVWRCWLGDPIIGGVGICHSWHLIGRSGPFSTTLEATIAGQASPQTLAVGTMPLAPGVSVLKSMASAAQMGLALIIAHLRRLHSQGWDYLTNQNPNPTSCDSPSSPPAATNLHILGSLSKQAVKFVRRKIHESHTRQHWKVGIRSGSQLQGLEAASSPQGYTWIAAPPGQYYADPFLFSVGGQAHLFVEAYDVALGKGRIAHMKLGPGGTVGPASTVLDRPYHLSYPFIFEHGGDIFMIPESGPNNTLELYRAVAFPDRWEQVKVLFNGPAADTTVLYHEGRFWFFVTLLDTRFPQALTLLLFHSQTLLGEWTLHPASPISTDIRVARGAGVPFLDRGAWIRPAQDGGETYGGGIRYQRIKRLDTSHYLEETVGALTRDMFPDALGTHTYNRDGDIEVIDIKLRIAKQSDFAGKS
jgi:hypothetical protein